MGNVASLSYRHLKSFYYKYNAEFRAHKVLDREKLPAPPRHKQTLELPKESTNQFKELHEKNQQLDEFLKKIYLTSSNEEKQIKSSRALPVKRESKSEMIFYEPEEPKPDCATLSSILKILYYYQNNPELNASQLALDYNLQKEAVINILTYYSLFKKEEMDFMNVHENTEKIEEKTLPTASNSLASKKIPQFKQIG